MKHLIFIAVLFLLPLISVGQMVGPFPKAKWQTQSTLKSWLDQRPYSKSEKVWLHVGIIVPGIVAGIAQGQNDVIQNNVWGYRYRHPEANERWWNVDSSWRIANGTTWFGRNFGAATKDKFHLNQSIATLTIATQYSFVAIICMDDLRRHKKPKLGKLLLYNLEANAARLLSKRATIEFYNVF